MYARTTARLCLLAVALLLVSAMPLMAVAPLWSQGMGDAQKTGTSPNIGPRSLNVKWGPVPVGTGQESVPVASPTEIYLLTNTGLEVRSLADGSLAMGIPDSPAMDFIHGMTPALTADCSAIVTVWNATVKGVTTTYIGSISRATKKVLWKSAVTGVVRTIITIDKSGRVFLPTSGQVYAFGPTGKRLWARSTASRWVALSPAEDAVYGWLGNGVVKLAANNGATLGSLAIGPLSTDTRFCVGKSGLVYVPVTDHVVALKPDLSGIAWNSGPYPVNFSYATSALAPDGSIRVTAEMTYDDPYGHLFAFDGATGAKMWEVHTDSADATSGMFTVDAEGKTYWTDSWASSPWTSFLHCTDAAGNPAGTGYSWDWQATHDTWYQPPVIAADGSMYYWSPWDGELIAFQ